MTAFHFGTTGETYYAKALPLTVSPWSTGVIAMTETNTTGWFSFANDPSINYAIYRQLGGSPASSDTAEGVIGAATQTLATGTVKAPPVIRSINDENPISFLWPASDATFTVRRSINDAEFVNATGTVGAAIRQEGTRWRYQLSYNAADRPSAEGKVQYELVSGGTTRYVSLRIEVSKESIATATKAALFAADSQDKKISLSGGGNAWTPDSVIVDMRSIADQVISEDGAIKFKLFFGDDENYGPAKRLYDMTAGSFEESTFTAQAFIDSGLATNVKLVEEANRVIDEIPKAGLDAV